MKKTIRAFEGRDFTKYHFQGQKNGEQILLVVHRHWFDILSQFFLGFLAVVFLFGGLIYFPILFPDLQEDQNKTLFLFLENLFFMLTWIIFFVIWIDYYFDVWIVTDRRIVNIEQNGLFSRTVSELELEKIQDITTHVVGVIPTFLNYGDLQVQTAAEQEKFLFRHVPDPYKIKDLLMNLQKESEREETNEFSELLSKKIHHDDIT